MISRIRNPRSQAYENQIDIYFILRRMLRLFDDPGVKASSRQFLYLQCESVKRKD